MEDLYKALYDDEGQLRKYVELNFHLTGNGKNYLKSVNKENNLFDLISQYEYAINCYKLPLYMFLYLFKEQLKNIMDLVKPIDDDYIERSLCGSGGCITCPFSCGEEAETVQNYGCLPDSYDIVRMKKESGHNWGCHSDETKICGGLVTFIKENNLDLDINSGGIIKYDTWYHEGEEVAINEADIEYKKLLDDIYKLI